MLDSKSISNLFSMPILSIPILSASEPDGSWIHRSPGSLTRGYPQSSVSLWQDCTVAWVDSVSSREILVRWKYPSDDDNGQTEYLIVSKSRNFYDKKPYMHIKENFQILILAQMR